MKKEYNDLANDEKKEYHFLKNTTLEIPYMLLSLFWMGLSIITYLHMDFYFSLLVLIALLLFTYFYYRKDKKEFKKLYGLN
jgi:asparagine N-glycosylation enzyme membrane subunit Stt3